MKRLSILGAAVLAALFAVESLAWDFLYSTPLGGRWVRSDNPLQVEEYDHRSEARLSALVEELGENQWRLYTVWNRTEYTCVDGSVAFPDGYDRTVYSPKTNALAIAAHLADTSNPHGVTSRQADEAGGTMNGAGAVLAMYGVGADKTNGVSLLDGYGDAIDSKYDRWVHAGDRDFWLIATNATWDFRTLGRPMWFGAGLATTGEVAEVESTASEALSTASTHAGNTNNPHQVTAAQIGALTAEEDPVWTEEKTEVWEAIGSLSNEVDNVLSAEADPVWVAASNAVLTDIANLRMDVDALSGGASNSISTVAAALEDHVEDTGNPHGVTPAQIDADRALRDYLGDTYGIVVSALPEGVSWLHGFDNNLSFEESEWWRSDSRDFMFRSTNSTWGFLAPSAPTYNGTALATVADIAGHEARQDNPHAVTAAQAGALPATAARTGWYVVDDPTDFEDDVNLLGETLAADLTASSLTVGGTTTRDLAEFATDDELAVHTGNTANPHHVTAAQVGALPLAGGTMQAGAYIYFGSASDNIHGGSDGIEISTDAGITLSAGSTTVSGPLDASDGLTACLIEADRVKIGSVTVTNWNNLPDSAANAAHRASTNNPHNMTLTQLDANGEFGEKLEEYGIMLDEVGRVEGINGFGNSIEFDINRWYMEDGFTFDLENGTINFAAESVPTWNGTNLATMTDLSVATADLASYTWVRSQIAGATAGSYASLAAFNTHTNDANAHGLGALRATVAELPTTGWVMTYVDDAIGDLGNVATMDDLSWYVPGTVYTAATNDLWGAFAGMATDADIAAATNGLAKASDVSALDGRVTVLESSAFGPDGCDFSTLVSGLVAVSGRVDTAESDIAALQEVAGSAWPTNPAADDLVVFPKMSYYQNSNDLAVIDPGFYDQSVSVNRSGAISNLALLKASKVEAGKVLVHGDPVLASTAFTSNYISGGSIISMPHTFTATNEPLWCHYNYPDYVAKLHFLWSNAVATEERTIVDADTGTETTVTVTNTCQPSVSLKITGTNMANEVVEFTLVPRLDGTDQVLYIDRIPLYLVRGFIIEASVYPVPTATADPVLVGLWYEKTQDYGDEYDLYGKVLMVDEPAEERGVANKAYVDDIVGGVDLSAIYQRDGATYLNGNEVVFNPRYTVTVTNNDLTISYGGFPVMRFKGGMKVVPVMTALSSTSNTIFAYCTGTADSELRLEWCTNLDYSAEGGLVFEDVPAARIQSQYMTDEYTWCTEIDATGIKGLWMRAWLTSLLHSLTDVEMETEDGTQSFAELFAKVAELQGATNLYATVTELTSHAAATNNPHNVTAAQIGALTAETDATALAALVAASNALRQAIADLGSDLPTAEEIAELEERVAELEAMMASAHDSGSSTNIIGSHLYMTALAAMDRRVWNDVAMSQDGTKAIFAGNNAKLWEEYLSGGKAAWRAVTNSELLNWKHVAMSGNGNAALALPDCGNPYFKDSVSGGFVAKDWANDYWHGAGMDDSGSHGVLVGDSTEWIVGGNGGWQVETTNQISDVERGVYLDYRDSFATAWGEIMLSGDRTLDAGEAMRRFAIVRTNQTGVGWRLVVDSQLGLPSGISTSATVVTRMPYTARPVDFVYSGVDSWPSGNYAATNIYTQKATGGPWVDVVVDATEPHPLYVRSAAKWIENTYARVPAEEGTVVTNGPLVRWPAFHFTNTYREVVIEAAQAASHTRYIYTLYPVYDEQVPPEGFDPSHGDTIRTISVPILSGDHLAYIPWDSVGWHWGTNSLYGIDVQFEVAGQTEIGGNDFTNAYNKFGYEIHEVTTNYVYTNLPAVKLNRMTETYEPIQAAGVRYWADVAVSSDTEMRAMWAIETDGKVWRMQGRNWRAGTWSSQDAVGTNHWKQVLCSADGARALVIGDNQVSLGWSDDDGPAVANAWYFDGDEWTAIPCQMGYVGGVWTRVKWKKAYLSHSGYIGYLLSEGNSYVNKLEYK